MKGKSLILVAGLVLAGLTEVRAIGYGDTQPRAMGMAGAYGAMARGVESLYWNPANLALSDGPKLVLPLNLGFSFILENNSISISDYNKYNGDFISAKDKDDILDDIDKEGLQFNTDLGLRLPVIGGAAFPLPWGLSSAVAIDVRLGLEGEMPKDMVEFLLFGNEFARDREARGRAPGYDIAEWDGSGWGLGIFSWGFARPYMPAQLKPYLSESTVGATVKIVGGGYGEILRSDGGMVTRVSGTDLDAYAITRGGGGTGFGIDLGATGVTKDRKTTVSVALVNFLDYMSWGISPQQDSVFVKAQRLRALSFAGKNKIDEIVDNPKDENGEVKFREQIDIESFSLSLPAMLRVGGAHRLLPKLMVTGHYDQAFSSGFGISAVPRLAAGLEYHLVDWFPVRFGLSVGGRAGMSSALGLAFGPFKAGRMQISLLDFAYANRGGFLPGLAQGAGLSLNFFRLSMGRV